MIAMTEPAFFGHENFLKSVRILSKNSKNSRYSRNNQNLNLGQATKQVSNILEFKKKKEIKTNSLKSRASYYNPSSGRFVSEDPTQFYSNDINFYRYGKNSPIMNIDPTGKIGLLGIVAIGGIAGGAGAFIGTLVGGGSLTDALSASVGGAISGSLTVATALGAIIAGVSTVPAVILGIFTGLVTTAITTAIDLGIISPPWDDETADPGFDINNFIKDSIEKQREKEIREQCNG